MGYDNDRQEALILERLGEIAKGRGIELGGHGLIRDLVNDPVEDVEADVCVVGAGAAGILLTVELLRLGKTVTLLEAGGRVIEEDSQEPYASEVVGRHHEGG